MWKPGKALNLSVSNRTTIPAEIADCKGLKVLHLSRTQVSDLTPLAKLENLKVLDLSRTQVNDLTPLKKLTRLETLSLSCTKVSDLKPLEKLTSLETLHLSYTQVSDNAETVKKLCAQGCRIFRWKSTA